ncbi:hypothetical protein S40285_03956 [Stachybotrys chlorohalonatus IBT 40285]|uniref:Mediator of RNA polymerase II transcription subunit 18 n=1 Tax=Stachybotrys chlorohalonatus (strain IBT 40285) TaxID=1283841 RepID=A0A084QKY5_STAC4|nr:hypothetical protein S40285_03956 [Stachybotrys chlorohalonata IBT 40285]
MYELFLTAPVAEDDFGAACAVLSGLCNMPPWETIHRVLYFQGPSRPVGLSVHSSIDKRLANTLQLWRELHQNFARQSFVLQARYEVFKDRDMGPTAAPMDLDALPGILKWTDFPDPPRGQPLLTQRKKVEIWDQRKLPSMLRENQNQFKTETIEEIYHFFRDDVEFTLTKQYFVQPIEEYIPFEKRQQLGQPRGSLPAWDSLTPVDLQNRWIFQVKAHVLQDNQPEEIRKAQEQLLAIRTELEGLFDFRPIDRKVHDTRVAQRPQGVQALPQRVTIDK